MPRLDFGGPTQRHPRTSDLHGEERGGESPLDGADVERGMRSCEPPYCSARAGTRLAFNPRKGSQFLRRDEGVVGN